tara:strand:- start:321 stop:1079 length:759 start_codon:yes stop_codon:yes gene_type:complete
MTDTVIQCFLFIIGAIMGSFYNVVSIRTIAGEKFYSGFSSCPNCTSQIKWFDNIPVISYLFLRGQCRNCKKDISLQYPLVEIITGFAFFACHSLQYDLINYIIFMMIISMLIIISTIDWLEQSIYSIHLLLLAIAIVFFRFSIGVDINPNLFVGAILMGIFLYLLRLIAGWYYKQEAMGIGDVKLAFIMGLMLDLQGAIVAMYIAFIVASLVGVAKLFWNNENERILPFAPFICLGGITSFLFNENIIQFLF